MSQSSLLSSASFRRLVTSLKSASKTCTAVEQCCGGLIGASILSQPGASAVYHGGSVLYGASKVPKLLLDDEALRLAAHRPHSSYDGSDPVEKYVNSKLDWTAAASVAYCSALGTDYCLAEGGASGPTFRYDGMTQGFAAVAVAGRDDDGVVRLLGQTVVQSEHARREDNMRLFADGAADLAADIISGELQAIPAVSAVPTPSLLTIDRATKLRSQPDVLAEMETRAKFVILRGNEVLVRAGSTTEPAFLDYDRTQTLPGERRTSFLGILSDEAKTPVFGVDLLSKDAAVGTDVAFVDTRTSAPLFSRVDNELVLHATALGQWQRRSEFCPLSGERTELIDGGTARRSPSGALSWPRQDPSMIAVVSSRCGEKVLLARSPRHPPKFHTVLAGFVEAGETYETAVKREAFEETGVLVDEGSAKYVGSQPWPFPQSSMIGFTATADATTPLVLEEEEIVSAGWFDRDQVMRAAKVEGATMQPAVAAKALEDDPDLELLIPPQGVIARKLIDTWLAKK
uniref:NAD(+) diphosphatase n=1 Tax=Corethron hystrix TaxID=216773 RepID=A0A7S1BU07_9STRA|mmetsp:Transcript_41027/g.96309  ORF Transcript_41027/g.96309 Transcript_41027/m.96309 type:complete len:515 (+) Transcript_41027:143-1687(+)